MLLLVATLLAAASASTTPARDMPVINPKAHQPAGCPATSRYEANAGGKAPGAHKLNQLPAAEAYRAVYRRIAGCEIPVIVRYGVGAR